MSSFMLHIGYDGPDEVVVLEGVELENAEFALGRVIEATKLQSLCESKFEKMILIKNSLISSNKLYSSIGP